MKAGDGGGLDTLVNAIDSSHLTTGGPAYDTLRPEAVLVGAKCSPNLGGQPPSFEIIPEASTYALGFGLFALGWVAFHRRRK
jgi:MYXO-CTERM domain-containing protein